MSGRRSGLASAASLLMLLSLPAPPLESGARATEAASRSPGPEAQAERLRMAKALFFDRKYAEARQAWMEVLAGSRGATADTAAYWIARCSENLDELERAYREYERFLARRPAERTLAEEARTSRIAVAARLVRQGRREYVEALHEGLADTSKSVRYFAALQLSGLGRAECERAKPTLRELLRQERDPDLVERAKLGLFRCDPDALAAETRRGATREVRWLRLRIYERGSLKPRVSLNLPMALARLFFDSLPEEARRELRKKGFEADTFWDSLSSLGPTEKIGIETDEKEKIEIWIE